jgi:hypothetical protein
MAAHCSPSLPSSGSLSTCHYQNLFHLRSVHELGTSDSPVILATWENCSSRPAQANSLWDPHLQHNQSKMDWQCASSSRVPALQAWSLEFKPQFHQKKKKSVHEFWIGRRDWGNGLCLFCTQANYPSISLMPSQWGHCFWSRRSDLF